MSPGGAYDEPDFGGDRVRTGLLGGQDEPQPVEKSGEAQTEPSKRRETENVDA